MGETASLGYSKALIKRLVFFRKLGVFQQTNHQLCWWYSYPTAIARKNVNLMAKFVFGEKLSKKAHKELDNQKRAIWAFSPTAMKVESKKLYNRIPNSRLSRSSMLRCV